MRVVFEHGGWLWDEAADMQRMAPKEAVVIEVRALPVPPADLIRSEPPIIIPVGESTIEIRVKHWAEK